MMIGDCGMTADNSRPTEKFDWLNWFDWLGWLNGERRNKVDNVKLSNGQRTTDNRQQTTNHQQLTLRYVQPSIFQSQYSYRYALCPLRYAFSIRNPINPQLETRNA